MDFPDFNFRLAKTARKLNIPVIYYIVPQIWAWRQCRVKFLKKNISHLIVILPFEEKWFGSRGLSTFYAVIPWPTKRLSAPEDREGFLTGLGLNAAKPVVALLPGSRRNEIKKTLPCSRKRSGF